MIKHRLEQKIYQALKTLTEAIYLAGELKNFSRETEEMQQAKTILEASHKKMKIS